jgi:hypothetical protein
LCAFSCAAVCLLLQRVLEVDNDPFHAGALLQSRGLLACAVSKCHTSGMQATCSWLHRRTTSRGRCVSNASIAISMLYAQLYMTLLHQKKNLVAGQSENHDSPWSNGLVSVPIAEIFFTVKFDIQRCCTLDVSMRLKSCRRFPYTIRGAWSALFPISNIFSLRY